jgi:hypothetical protein
MSPAASSERDEPPTAPPAEESVMAQPGSITRLRRGDHPAAKLLVTVLAGGAVAALLAYVRRG